MAYIFAVLCIAAMVLSLMLLMLGLPGNWVILGLAALWSFFGPVGFGGKFFLLLAGLALLGEVLEFLAGYFGGKRFGGTNKGSIGGIVGALVLGFMCAPLFFGFGALLGAMLGGFAGSFIVELIGGMPTGKAAKAAFGSMLGRLGGFLAKLGIGISMIVLTAPRIWESV